MEVNIAGKNITFNGGQVQALEQLEDFSNSKRCFTCLSGSAGTGKTTIMKHAFSFMKGNIAVSAPTHKAKNIIGRTTGKAAVTVHSLIGLKPNMNLEEFTPQNMAFSLTKDEKICEYRKIIIDESSMLHKFLKEYIKERAKYYGVQIIFMGDNNQLPPVKESHSTVFIDDEIEQIKLYRIERQSWDNPLMSLYDSILKDIDSVETLHKRNTDIYKGKGYSFYNDIKSFGQNSLEYFHKNDNQSKMLVYDNANVLLWNNFFRNELLSNFDLPVKEGEILMGYRTIMETKKIYLIQNSSEYRVMRVNPYVIDGYKGFYITLKDIDTNLSTKMFIINQKDKDTLEKYMKKHTQLLNAALAANGQQRGMLFSFFYQFKDKYMLLGDIYGNSGSIIAQKELDFAYSMTIHKSQGSTYQNVFVDEKSIHNGIIPSHRNRLKYVAFSRPTDLAFINY